MRLAAIVILQIETARILTNAGRELNLSHVASTPEPWV
jgi:hypothetical protein